MALISLKDVQLRFGDEPLFAGIDLHIQSGDRLVLLGRNGVGKSTLLRLIAGRIEPDSGAAAISNEVRVALLSQEDETGFVGTALEYCLEAANPPAISEVEAQKFLTRLGMQADEGFATLSGGGRRRVMLAAALAAEPEVLLLDEPTNHLDIDTAIWLEGYLQREAATLLMITHDRAFAKAVANRVAELDRGELFSFDCGYEEFLRRRDSQLESEQQQRAAFDRKLAAEEAWLRRGVKARRTRDEGRVRALLKMREEFRQRRNRLGSVNLKAEDAGRSGKLVAEVSNLSFTYPDSQEPDRPLIHGLSTTIMRGDKVGIVGPNGAGKTTLIRLLLGELTPDAGHVRTGTNLQPLYFDQMRSQLDPDRTVVENLSGGDDQLIVGGKPKHVNAYLQDFLFNPERARNPVKILSGGERNRLLLAKLFAQPSNLLILDEPTNDLDMETLDLLEDMLLQYPGTVLLVSHDREFLDNVVTDCLVFTPDGDIHEFVGGYSDWRQRVAAGLPGGTSAGTAAGGARSAGSTGNSPTSSHGDDSRSDSSTAAAGSRPTRRERKLSYKEARELESLPERIAGLEQRIEELHTAMADPEFYRQEGDQVAQLTGELQDCEEQLEAAFHRWEELDQLPQ
ncbi:ATP-binding cassette domain-containing protein [Spirochaeta africana]|uniref:ATP-binding protein Uup n=1 Tax=Spirochaeta africana (strain ATCC 700263 / DSM 8902 / Z-7692) TaxID=889378 RepID=H9UJW9_SPIAZ|nr:ATP-binding cassette domain-containing protein [Spirochaeta africana]AFG37812.1 ATPase component of ABC transporters with duplicated ATPase domain [Spirochaeta africana DSM 8902]